jgi:hypothetical protein
MLSKCNISVVMLFFFLISNSYSQSIYKLQDFGIKSNKLGEIDLNSLTQKQKDTIAIGVITIDDYLEDVAIYYKSIRKIRIFKNNGNGTYCLYRNIESDENIKSISLKIDREKELRFSMPICDLEIKYKDGRSEKINNNYLNSISNERNLAPIKNFLDEPRAFLYDISYIKQWQSEPSGEVLWFGGTYGDIDGDGKNEAIFTFFPTGDTFPYQHIPSRMVVFECVSGSTYRIDWDTLLVNGGYNIYKSIFDIDGDGNKEFFGDSFDRINNCVQNGIWECYGEGKYKWRLGSFGSQQVYDLEIQEAKKVIWVLETSWDIHSVATKWVYTMKTDYSYQFTPTIWAGDIFIKKAYAFNVGDIDEDGKEEIILSTSQGGSYGFYYLDSTGGGQTGYEKKLVTLNEPLAAGWTFLKDFDGDDKKEIIIAGPGDGSGSLGILKHYGSPGENNFSAPWWDSAGIFNGPNLDIDSNYIDNIFCVLFPSDYYSTIYKDSQRTHIFRRNGTYSFTRSLYFTLDTVVFLGASLFDINKNGKMNIMTSLTKWPYPEPACFLTDYEQYGTIGINTISTTIPSEFNLEQNYPNPFNPTTNIKYHITKSSNVNLKVYDLLGKK